MTRKVHAFVQKVVYPMTIVSMVLGSLGPVTLPVHAAIVGASVTVASGAQTLGASSAQTSVFTIDLNANGDERLTQVNLRLRGVKTADSFIDLAPLAANNASSGISLYQDNATQGTVGSFDVANDTLVPLQAAPSFNDNYNTAFRLTATDTALSNDTTKTLNQGDIVFADYRVNSLTTYDWHMVTTGNSGTGGFASTAVKLDNQTGQPTFATSQVSRFQPAATGVFNLSGTSSTTQFSSDNSNLVAGDMVLVQLNSATITPLWQVALQNASATSTLESLFGSQYFGATNTNVRLSKVTAAATRLMTVPRSGAITLGAGTYTPANGDLVLYNVTASDGQTPNPTLGGRAKWGVVTNNALTAGVFAIDGVPLHAGGTYRLNQFSGFVATSLTRAATTGAITAGSPVFVLTAGAPTWHMVTTGTTNGGMAAAELRLDGATIRPTYDGPVGSDSGGVHFNDYYITLAPATPISLQNGKKFFVVVRTSATAGHNHQFTMTLPEGGDGFGVTYPIGFADPYGINRDPSPAAAGFLTTTTTPTYTITTQITALSAAASAQTAQTLGPSSAATPVLGFDVTGIAGNETLASVTAAITPSAGFVMSDFASMGTSASSGITLYKDDNTAGTQGTFDNDDDAITLAVAPAVTDGTLRASKLAPTNTRVVSDSSLAIAAGDIVYADVTANAAPTTGYAWHMVTVGATGVNSNNLNLDGATVKPTYRTGSNQFSQFTPAQTGSFTVSGTATIVPASVSATPTYAAPAVGDIVFYHSGTGAGRWGIVTNATLTNGSGTFANDGTALMAGTYIISKVAGQTGSFVLGNNGTAITPPGGGAGSDYTLPAVGDLVLYQTATNAATWGAVTNATLTVGQFAVDGMTFAPSSTYRISKITSYVPTQAAQKTFTPSALPTGADAIQSGDLVFGMPTANPVSTSYDWHIATGDTSAGVGNLRFDGKGAAPGFGFSAMMGVGEAVAIPQNNTGANAGADYFVVVRTAAGAVNNHAFSVALKPGAIFFSTSNTGSAPAETVSATYTLATTAQQQQSAGASTTAIDQTNGFLRLKQSSDFKSAVRVQFGSTDAGKTLSSIAMTFATANSTTPTWTSGQVVSSELLDLATTNGGVSLWKDAGSPGFGLNGAGDTQVTLAPSPVYGASNAFTLTPATPPTLVADDVYFIVLKSDTSGVTNNNEFTIALAANAITLSANSPTISQLTTPPIRMDTTAPMISSVSPVNPGTPNQLDVRFSEPVQKINGGGAITFTSATDPFTYTDAGGTAQTISSLSHNAFSDFATLTMSANLDATDLDSTPATLASASSGTGTLESTGMTVTGTGTAFTTQLAVGNVIRSSGQVRVITAITNNTSLTTNTAFNPVLNAGSSFTFSNRIEDGAGNVLDPTPTNLGSPLNFTTVNIPSTFVGAIHTTTPLVTLAAAGGTPGGGGKYSFATNAPEDATKLTNLGLTLGANNGTDNGKLTGTIAANTAGSHNVTIRVTDSSAPTPQSLTRQFVITVASVQGGTVPGITNVNPPAGAVSTTATLTITGSNTAFVQGTSQVSLSLPPNQGTGTIESTTIAVTGTGTSFTTQLAVGDSITANGQTKAVAAITNNTSLTVDSAFSSNLSAGTPFTFTKTNGITVGSVTVASATSLTVPVTIAANAAAGSRDVIVTTGTQVVTRQGGFSVTAALTAGLNLVFPTDSATGIQLPAPGFQFSPSTNTTYTNYRVSVSTTQDFASLIWDYAFPKPADSQNTNGSHCNTTSCNVMYGEGKFLVVTQPTPLAPNSKYYWRVQTYKGTLTATVPIGETDVTNVLNKLEDTPVRNFTTVTSVTDTQPPQIEHRPLYEARTNAALTVYARVNDNIARTTTNPALSTTIYACRGAACVLPATTVLPSASATDGVVAGASVGANYFSYTIPVEIVGASAGTGTGTIASTGTTVIGTGTAFTTQLAVGDIIRVGAQERVVATITNNTSLTTDLAFDPVVGAGTAFTFGQRIRYQITASDGTNTTTFNQPPATGTGTLESASTAVTGTGTLFTTQLTVGDTISAGGQNRTITAITNATSLTTDSAFNPALTAGAPFTFSKPFQVTTTAAAAATISGTVKDSTDTCSTAVQEARVFAEGTGFNTTSSNDVNCTYTLSGLSVGAPYNLIAVKDGFADSRKEGVPAGSTGKAFKLGQGTTGGFGGDSTKPRVKFNAPNDGMQNMPGNFSGFMVMVAFDKPMSQTSITTTGNMTVSELNVQDGTLTNITTTKGAWTYNPTFTMPFGGFTESNVATWALSQTACSGAPCTLGDNKTFAVTVTSSVTDTAGNAVQSNQSDGSFTFTFSTGSTFTGGQTQTVGQGSFIPPHVVGTTPPPGGFDVPRNSKVLINFDKAMADDGTGYTLLSNIKLFEVTGTPPTETETDVSSVALNSASLSSDKQIAQVTLKSTYPTGCSGAECGIFKSSAKYRLKVLGGAKGATGVTLDTQAALMKWMTEFKTSSTSDTAAPTVTGSTPDTGATGVAVTTGAISLSFNKDMDPSTISTTTITLTTGSTSVSGTAEYRSIEKTAYFLPKSSLTPNTTYTVTVTTGAKGLNGVALAASATRTFTTGAADTTAPKIVSMRADDNNIAITFNQPMNASKATDTDNFSASVLKSGNYTLKYGTAGFNAGSGGTTITLPATASFVYDPVCNTVMLQGYRPSSITPETVRSQELYVSLASVKGLSGVDISTTNSENTSRVPIENSGTTGGALGPCAVTSDAFIKGGDLIAGNFSGTTHGFVPSAEVRPVSMQTGNTTTYGVRLPISKQITSGGTIVLTFPTGFDVTLAQQDINSPKRRDINGGGPGSVTFKCLTDVATNPGKSCAGTANTDDDESGDTGKGGLVDDGVVVSATGRTVTIYINGATRSEGGDTHDFLDFDIAGIKNSTSPKDFTTSGYTVDVKTKSGATNLESLTSMPFFIQSGGTNTVSGTITATGNTQAGTMKVYLDSPMTGPQDATTVDFSDSISLASDGAAAATYSFTSVPNGEFVLRTDPYITIGTAEFVGKYPERLSVSGNVTKNITIAGVSASGTAVTVSVNGPASELIDIFAGAPGTPGQPPQFRKLKKRLDTNASAAENFTITLPDGDWFLGVGPQMPDGPMSGPPPTPTYLPPKPKNVRVASSACTIEGVTTCTTAFTLTATTKTIQGLVKDGSDKILTDAEVYAYSPQGGFGTRTKSDAKGAFSLGVADGLYNVGAFIPGMPQGQERSVEVTSASAAEAYLKIDGAAAITSTAAATSFVLKLAKPDLSISGKVTNGTSVIQGATVYAYKQNAPGNAMANTGSDGSYTLYVGAGTWRVGVHLPQYGNLTEQTVSVTTANVTNINFSPSSTGTFYTVSGTVTSGGQPVQGAFARIRGNGYFNDAQTGSDGTYSFKVPVGNGYVIDGFLPNVGDLPPLAAFNVTNADVTGKDLTVATLRTITFAFGSLSVERAFIELRAVNGSVLRKEMKNATSTTLSAPDGSYVVRVDLPGAPIPFGSVAATDANTTYANTTGLLTVNGNEGLTVTVPTLRTITFTVTDGTNTIADAFVELNNPTSGLHFGGKTATNGTVSLSAADGTYLVNAMKPGLVRDASSLIINSTTTAQTLTTSAATRTIMGQVLVGSTGVADAFVRAEKGSSFAGTKTDPSGNYTLSLNEGAWTLFAIAEGYAEARLTGTVDVTTASATGKNITLTTTVTVLPPKSKPITPSTGGSLEDTTAGIKLNIPANALGTSSSAGNIEAKKTSNIIETGSGRPLVGLEITATDSNGTPIKTLNENVTVEITQTKAELAASKSDTDSSIDTKAEVEKLQIAFWDESVENWTTISTTITYYDSAGALLTSLGEGTLTALGVESVKLSGVTNHFSLYAPLVPTDSSAPTTPTLSLGAVTSSSITLGWVTVSGATGYNIYRSTSSTGTFSRLGSEPSVSSGSTTSYTDSGLSASQTFFYKITALNNNSESAASSALSGTSSAATSSSSSSSSSSSAGGGSSSSSSSTATTTTTTTTATTITATSVAVTNTNTVATVTKGIAASTLGVSAINAANLEVKQTGAATTTTTDKKDVAAQQLKDMKSVDAKEKKAQDALTTLEGMVTKGTATPVALSQNITRFEVKEKTTGKTASVTRVEQSFAPSKDAKDVTIVMTVPKSVAERASALTFTGIQPEVLQDDPILRWIFAEVKAGETKDLSYQVNKNLDKLEVKNVAVAAAPAAGEMAWGFKDGKFQLMPKAEADALHEAAEKAKKEASPKEDKKTTTALEKKTAVTKAKATAKPLVTVKALPHLSAKAAKVVTNVLKRSAIIILPQDKGMAFYLDPKTQKRASLGRPAEAFEVMRSFGKGITNKDLEKIPESMMEGDTTFACKHAGTIFLQVESKGEAWYVHPENCKRYFLNRPSDAFELMRKLALGVSNADATAIPVSEKSKPVTPATPAQPAQPKEEPKKAAVPAMSASAALDQLPPLARPLYNGMKGDDVKTLQTILAQKGYYAGAVSGTMDEATFAAVREMQLKEGLAKSTSSGFGTVGPATRAFVNKLLKEAKGESAPAPAAKKEEPKPAAKTEVKAVETKPKQETAPAPKAAEQAPAPSGESALDKLKRLLK